MATACHGKATFAQNRQLLIRGTEYSFWRDFDPHAQAAETLASRRSQEMIAALKFDTPALTSQRCGCCHSPTGPSLPSFVENQGVTCESCHGAAEHWRGTHFRSRGPHQGMITTKNLEVRAQVCTSCHVGDVGRRVDHDMIAAGHPPLQFELASYHSRLPKHWDETEDRGRHSSFETELWAQGQAAQLRESLRQQDAPADLAGLDCYACHHDLQPQSWAQASDGLSRLVWSSWSRAVADAAVELEISSDLEELALNPMRDSDNRASQLRKLLLDAKVRKAPTDVFQALQQQFNNASFVWNWDAAAQSYLAITAVYQDVRGQLPPPTIAAVVADLNFVRSQLKFPDNYHSPRDYGAKTSPAKIRDRLQRVIKILLQSTPGVQQQ